VGAVLGATVARARSMGVAMPLTERLIALIEELERGQRPMAWANLDELAAIAAPRR
jgi:2-dehydropantoate 2-reductase